MEGQTNLTFVPIDDLVNELERRCSCFIMAYETPELKSQKNIAEFKYGKGSWFDAVRLASILNNDVLNNWCGELQTLQRINEDEQ